VLGGLFFYEGCEVGGAGAGVGTDEGGEAGVAEESLLPISQ
jgi:hypothetical protein